jgi:hypothetical protein
VAYSRIQICFCIGNDMSWVHGSVDPVVCCGQIWTGRNGGRRGCAHGQDNDGVVLTGGEGRRQSVKIESVMKGNIDG